MLENTPSASCTFAFLVSHTFSKSFQHSLTSVADSSSADLSFFLFFFGVFGGYILGLYVLKIASTHSTWWCPRRIAAEPSLSCCSLAVLALSHWKMTQVSHVSVALRTFSMKASLTPGGRFSFIRIASISLIALLMVSLVSSFLHLKRWS